MQIYLLRHGIAEDARAGQPDSERALTSEGRDKLRRVLKRARSAELDPTTILSSPYRRAVETAAVAAEVLGYKGDIVRVQALTPEASPHDTWQEIRDRQDERSILLASHEPLMSSLTAFLLDSPSLMVDMKKAALVRIDVERVGPKPRGILKWMLTPGVCLE
ncbi:MAG: putative phosphohistidine phosphatase, SixA [Candidatus Solibacter sp.]|jgi:phosphohistidine phosphatase|nr:putative phosphohistidine phosphatase, SixA [Candidatus Solibacter sp.]